MWFGDVVSAALPRPVLHRRALQRVLFADHHEQQVGKLMARSLYRAQAEATERVEFMREIGLGDA